VNEVNRHTRQRNRFWARVDKHGPTIRPELGPCWLWLGNKDRQDYGMLKIDGVTVRAHRYSFYLHYSVWPVPCGLHHCDNPPCCNPAHVFEGTVSDNNKDAANKHRSNWISGSKHVESKLTEPQVIAIRQRVTKGEVQRSLAKEYGVCPATICDIVSKKKWRHV
jgi:CENP-B N-terminal DNA-binding domain